MTIVWRKIEADRKRERDEETERQWEPNNREKESDTKTSCKANGLDKSRENLGERK